MKYIIAFGIVIILLVASSVTSIIFNLDINEVFIGASLVFIMAKLIMSDFDE